MSSSSLQSLARSVSSPLFESPSPLLLKHSSVATSLGAVFEMDRKVSSASSAYKDSSSSIPISPSKSFRLRIRPSSPEVYCTDCLAPL